MSPLVTTLVLDGAVIVLVVVLFKILHSQATASGTVRGIGKWTAGGAIAGFLILMGAHLYIIGYLTPKGNDAHPSYQAVRDFFLRVQAKNYDEAWNGISRDMQQRAY